jgi:preprotein translocase SecE subunit
MTAFLQEAYVELRKRTTWPNWDEVRGTTSVVIIAMCIIAAFLWVVDNCLGFLYYHTVQFFR